VTTVNANIVVGINSAPAIAGLKSLQSQLTKFNQSLVAGNSAAAATQAAMAANMASMIGATGQFATSVRTMRGSVATLGSAFDKGTLSARKYFQMAGSQVPGLAKSFKSLGVAQTQMNDLARSRVKALQTQYVSLGRDVRGVQKVMSIRPKTLAPGFATDLAMAQQRMQLMNKAIQMGSTGLVNWGKNTQWAGRQLMVGFTIPLTIFAGVAAKVFKDLEKETIAFKKVYGDIFTSEAETERNLKAVKGLASEYTKYGIAVKDTMALANMAAQSGQRNADLTDATTQATRLSVLGQMESQEAMKTTISLQTAFGLSSDKLAESIDFLNIVENQSVLSLQDVAGAIPRVAPVIQSLGGDIKDMSALLVAMKEGGVSAAEGANALKSSLGRLIVPSRAAREMAQGLGIDLGKIVSENRGEVLPMIKELATQMERLGGLEQQQLLSQIFGKFQYARIGALFKSITDEASQANRIIKLMEMSTEELAQTSEKELKVVEDSVGAKFTAAIERLKVAIAPIGEMFLKAITPIAEVLSTVMEWFTGLSDGVKKTVGIIIAVVGGIAPVFLMGLGLIGNAVGNGIKIIGLFMRSVMNLGARINGTAGSLNHMTYEEIEAATAMAQLSSATSAATGNMLIQEGAIRSLTAAYRGLAASAASAAASMPRGAIAGPGLLRGAIGAPTVRVQGFNKGGTVPGTGNKDTIPAILTPGEMVVNKKASAKYGPIIAAMNNNTLPGFNAGYTYIYGENRVRLQPGGENAGGGASKPTRQQVAPVMALRVAEAMGMKATTAAVQMGRLDALSKRVDTFAKKFTDRVGQHFDKTYAHIADANKRLEKAWNKSGKQLRREGDALAREVSRNAKEHKEVSKAIRRYTGAAPDVYNTGTTKNPSSGGVFNSTRKPILKRGSAPTTAQDARGRNLVLTPVKSYAALLSPAMALGQRMYSDADYRGYQMGHVGSKVKVPLSEIEKAHQQPGVKPGAEMRKAAEQRASEERQSKRTRRNAEKTEERQNKQKRNREASEAKKAKKLRTRISSARAANPETGARAYSSTARKVSSAGNVRMFTPAPAGFVPQMSVTSSEPPPPPGTPPRSPSGSKLTERQIAAARAKIARRQFRGALGGLGAVLLSGPIADIQKFAGAEAKTFSNQMKKGIGVIGKGLSRIGRSVAESGAMMISKIPNDPGKAMAGAVRGAANRTMDRAIPGAFRVMDRGAAALGKGRSLVSDMGQALQGRDVKSATKMLANAIGGPNTVRQMTDAKNKFIGGISKTGQEVVKAGKHIAAAYGGANSVRDAAAMTSKIIGTTKVYDSIKANAIAAGQTIGKFKTEVGKRLRDVGTIFRTQGFGAATVTASEAVGLNKALRGVRDSLIVGKDSIVKTAKSIPDRALRGMDRALGGYKVMKQGFSSSMSNLGTSMSNMALRSFDRALGGWGALKKSFAGVGPAMKTAVDDGAKAIRNSLRSAATTILGTGRGGGQGGSGGGGGIMGMFGGGRPERSPEERELRRQTAMGRYMAGGMALSMGAMIPFMNQDSEGKFMGVNANMLGMGMMGGGALLSMAGIIKPKIIALTAAVAAAGIAVYAWRNSVDNAARKAAEFGSNIGGSANALKNMSDMLGKQTPAQKQTKTRLAFTEEEQEASFGEFQNMFETDAGKKFIEDLKGATSGERFRMLSDYISTAVAAGIMDVGRAPLFAKTIADALGDAFVGTAVVASIRKGLQQGSSGLLDMARERDRTIQSNEAISRVEKGEKISYQDSSTAIGASFQAIQDFSNAAGLARQEYIDGIISYEDYISVLKEATAAQAKYSGILSDSIKDTPDLGATAQALDAQMKLLFGEEDFKKMFDAADSEIGDWLTNTNSAIDRTADASIKVLSDGIMGLTGRLFLQDDWEAGEFSLFESGFGTKEIKTHKERMEAEAQTRASMTEAVLSGMNAGSVAAIQQYIKENPESKAAETLEKYKDKGGGVQYRAAAAAANVEFLGLPGDLESLLTEEQYVDIAISFMEIGGTTEDFEAFINSIPEERVVEITTAFTGMEPQDQIKMIANWQKLTNTLGQDLAEKVDLSLRNRAAATEVGVPVQDPRSPRGGMTTTTTLGDQQAQLEGDLQRAQSQLAVTKLQFGISANTEDVERAQAEVDRLQGKLNDIETQIYEIKLELDEEAQREIERAIDSGAWSEKDTLKVIELVLRQDPDNLAERLPELTAYAKDLQDGIPDEVLKRFDIDMTSLSDLEEYGPLAEDLRVLSVMLESFPDEVDKEVAVSLMMNENGKPVTVKQYGKDVNKLIEIQRDFASKDSVVQKKAVVELLQLYRGPDGSQLTEEQALNAFNDLVARFGPQQIVSLPWDILKQTIAVQTDVAGIDKAIAALQAAMKVAGGKSAALMDRMKALQQLKNAALNMQVGLVTGGSVGGSSGTGSGSGGNSGGGGGGDSKKSPAELVKEMIKELKLQLKFLGEYKKVGDKVKSGLAQALRNAGAPEELIADIISKGKDGVKIAEKLLKNKAKELKKITKLMIDVARLTLVETQRAEARSLNLQTNAQMALANSGINPQAITNMEPEQAKASADAYKAYQEAQRKADAAEGKGEAKRKAANKELEKARKRWEMVTKAIEENTFATNRNEAVQESLQAQQEAIDAQNQLRASLILSGTGMSAQDISAAIQSPGVANTVVGYMNKIKELEKQEKSLIETRKKAGKEWKGDKYKNERKRLAQIQQELKKVNGDYKQFIESAKKIPKSQRRAGVIASALGFSNAASELRNQRRAERSLIKRGYTFEQARELSQDSDTAKSIIDAERDVSDAQKRLENLEGKRKKAKKGSEEWKEITEQIKNAKKELTDAKKAQDALNTSLKEMTKEQRKSLVSGVTKSFKIETDKTKNQRKAIELLMGRRFTYDQASSIAGNEENAAAVVAAQEDVNKAKRRLSSLQEKRSDTKKGSEEWKNLTGLIKSARQELKDARNDQNNLTKSIRESTKEQQKLNWKSTQQKINEEIAKQANTTKFINLGITDQLILNRLNSLSLEDQNYFLSLNEKQQKKFLSSLEKSIPLSEKLAEAFRKVSAAQKLQSLLNEEATNQYMGSATDEYDEQLKLLQRQREVQEDILRGHQKIVDAIQEENDDFNRGLELISRQEEKINESFDKRIEALDKIERVNSRVAKQQQNQLNLSQALASGDIYAATQAAQQIKQDNASAAIENTREAIEKSREEQLKNLVVEVNGQLLTREEIEKRIEANNDRIYQIQEDMIEPIEAIIESLGDQELAVSRLKDQWQDYYEYLEKNAVDPLTGLKYKDLSKLKEVFDAIFDAQEIKDAGLALEQAMRFTGIQMTPMDFYQRFGIDPSSGQRGAGNRGGWEIFSPAYQSSSEDDKQFISELFGGKEPNKSMFEALDTNKRRRLINAMAGGLSKKEKRDLRSLFGISEDESDGESDGSTTQDINSGKEAAIAALPEVVKVKQAAKDIKKAMMEIPSEIINFSRSIVKNAQPAIDETREKANRIVNRFKAMGSVILEELIPNALTPLKDFLEGGLLNAAEGILKKFRNMNTQILSAIANVGSLALSLGGLEREIRINIVVNTTHTTSGSPAPTPSKPKKFAGGLLKMATGGMVPGGIPRDSVPILASPGEFVVRNAMVDKYGISFLNDINQGSYQPSFRTPSGPTYTKISRPTEVSNSRTMYNNNYSISVTANTNANADDIANATVMKIRQMNSMQIRGARG
jgi:TP901 family phage tail tape measure protein